MAFDRDMVRGGPEPDSDEPNAYERVEAFIDRMQAQLRECEQMIAACAEREKQNQEARRLWEQLATATASALEQFQKGEAARKSPGLSSYAIPAHE